jgi:hypothetical protein
MVKAKKDLPPPVLAILLSEYRAAANLEGRFDYATPQEFLTPAEIEDLIARLKRPKAPFKDARTQVTFYPETGTARVSFMSQGYSIGDTIVKSGEELWKLLRRAASDGIDFQAPKPAPYFTESADDWLKTHRPTKLAQKKIFQQGSITITPTKKKKPSMALQEILALDLKL